MDIYIKPLKKACLDNRNSILAEDVAEIYAPDEIIRKVKKIKLMDINAAKKAGYIISSMDILKAIDRELPGNTISCVGEIDTLVDYKPRQAEKNRLHTFIKVFLISAVIFMGASTAIMSFHNDADLPKVFQNYYYILFGEKNDHPLIIYLPYSLGLAAGIIVFFNHFMGKKLTEDPTPIEVEISTYEKKVTDTKLDALSKAGLKGEGK